MLQHKLLTILSSQGNVNNNTYYFRNRGLFFRVDHDRDPQERQGYQSEGGNTAATTSDASASWNRDMLPPSTIPTRSGYGVSVRNVWEGSDINTYDTDSWDMVQGTR